MRDLKERYNNEGLPISECCREIKCFLKEKSKIKGVNYIKELDKNIALSDFFDLILEFSEVLNPVHLSSVIDKIFLNQKEFWETITDERIDCGLLPIDRICNLIFNMKNKYIDLSLFHLVEKEGFECNKNALKLFFRTINRRVNNPIRPRKVGEKFVYDNTLQEPMLKAMHKILLATSDSRIKENIE